MFDNYTTYLQIVHWSKKKSENMLGAAKALLRRKLIALISSMRMEKVLKQ